MALNFPPNPIDGQLHTDSTGVKWIYNATKQRWARYAQHITATFVQDTEPTATAAGQFWYDTANELLKLWDGTTWVEAGGGGGGGASAWNDLTGTADSVPFTITAPNGAPTKGVLAWDGAEETLSLGLAHDSVLQLGQETLYHVQNASMTTPIADGTPVMYSGTVGNSGRMYVTPWSGNVADVKKFMGLATGPIPPRSTDADTGYVTHFGKVRGIKTDGDGLGETWSNGQILYLKKGAGGLTNVAPTAPGPRTIVALVLSAHSNNGTLFVRVTHGSNLGDDELVQLSGLANRNALLYDGATSRFVNRAIVSADVSDATASPDGGKIVLRDATGGASFWEQININGTDNSVIVQGAAFTFTNSTNSNVLGVTVPFAPTANRTITFPDASGTVSLVGHTHTSADITDVATLATANTLAKRDSTGGLYATTLYGQLMYLSGKTTGGEWGVQMSDPASSYFGFLQVGEGSLSDDHIWSLPDASGTLALDGHTHLSSDISDATPTATADKIVIRDASGNASFAKVTGSIVAASNGTNESTLNPNSLSITNASGKTAIISNIGTANRSLTIADATGTFALTSRTDGVPDDIIPYDGPTVRANLGLGTTNSVQFAGLNITGITSLGGAVTSSVTGGSTSVLQWSFSSGSYNYFLRGDGLFQGSSFLVSGLHALLSSNGLKIKSNLPVAWSNADAVTGSSDTFLYRDEAANTLAQRNGTNAQTFRLYRTYTSASSYQRLSLSTAADAFNFAAESTSTSNLDLNLLPQGTGKTKTTNLDATGDITASGGAGEVDINSLYGSGLQFRSVEAVVNTTTGTSSAIATGLIPAGAIVMGVVVRVNTTITGPTTFAVGDGTTADRWGTGIPLTAGTTTSSSSFVTTSLAIYPSATNVVLTASGGNFTTGAVRVCVHYLQISQLTA